MPPGAIARYANSNLRETPNANARVVRAEGDWLKVESKRGGKPGYIEKRDVERGIARRK